MPAAHAGTMQRIAKVAATAANSRLSTDKDARAMKHSMLFALTAIAGLGFSVALTSPVQADETTCMACYSDYKRCVTRAETPEQDEACNTRYHACRRACTSN